MKMSRLACMMNMRANGGNLVVSNNKVTGLPDNLHIKGDLDLTYAYSLTLPKGLVVDGNVYIGDTIMKEIPSGTVIGKTLMLEGSAKIKIGDIQVGALCIEKGNDVTISSGFVSNSNVEMFGAGKYPKDKSAHITIESGARIGGDLKIQECDEERERYAAVDAVKAGKREANIVNIGAVQVRYNVEISGAWIPTLGPGLTIGGDFIAEHALSGEIDTSKCSIRGKTEVTSNDTLSPREAKRIMHENEGDLIVPNNISALPEGLLIPGSLIISNAPLLTHLPNEIFIGGALEARRSNLEELPEGVKTYNGYVDIRESKVGSIPQGIDIRGDLYANNSELEKLPAIYVSGNAYISSSRVHSIEAGLVVNGSLYAENLNITEPLVSISVGRSMDIAGTHLHEGMRGIVCGEQIITSPFTVIEERANDDEYVGKDETATDSGKDADEIGENNEGYGHADAEGGNGDIENEDGEIGDD